MLGRREISIINVSIVLRSFFSTLIISVIRHNIIYCTKKPIAVCTLSDIDQLVATQFFDYNCYNFGSNQRRNTIFGLSNATRFNAQKKV